MVETFPGCFLCVLPYEAWVLLSRPIIQTLFCWAIQITVHWWVSNVWNWVGGIILPSPRYNTRVLAFSQSRSVDFHSRQAPPTPFYLSQLLHLCSPFFSHPKLPPVRFCQLPKGFKQLLLIFTHWHLLQRDRKRVNNESYDGGGSDGRSLWLNQQASRGGGRRPQLEVCPRLPGAKLLNFSFMLMLVLMLIMRLKMLNPILTHGVPNWRCVPGYQV